MREDSHWFTCPTFMPLTCSFDPTFLWEPASLTLNSFVHDWQIPPFTPSSLQFQGCEQDPSLAKLREHAKPWLMLVQPLACFIQFMIVI